MSTGSEDFLSEPVEILTLTINECFIYKVPPLRSASGHRAEDWKLETPLFTGCLKVFQADTKLKICIYAFKDPKTLSTANENITLFGECPIEVKPGDNIINFVDAVIDSSRYYVVRIKDPKSTRTTLLGVGFREREQAFDFKNILNDYVRYISRMDLASQMAACAVEDEEDPTNSAALAAVAHINPLKEGEKIKINIGHSKKPHNDTTTNVAGETKAKSGGFLLKPPPAPGSTVFLHVPTGSSTSANPVMSFNVGNRGSEQASGDVTEDPFQSGSGATTNDEDDWGDFSSS